MPVDFTTYSNTLQARLNSVSGATTATELLLLAKASESSIGNANVSAVNAAGSAQVTAVNDAGTAKLDVQRFRRLLRWSRGSVMSMPIT